MVEQAVFDTRVKTLEELSEDVGGEPCNLVYCLTFRIVNFPDGKKAFAPAEENICAAESDMLLEADATLSNAPFLIREVVVAYLKAQGFTGDKVEFSEFTETKLN